MAMLEADAERLTAMSNATSDRQAYAAKRGLSATLGLRAMIRRNESMIQRNLPAGDLWKSVLRGAPTFLIQTAACSRMREAIVPLALADGDDGIGHPRGTSLHQRPLCGSMRTSVLSFRT